MAETAITTRAPGQEGLIELTGLANDYGGYCVSINDSERTDMAAFLRGFNRNHVIEVKNVPDRPWQTRLGLTGYHALSPSPVAEMHILSGIRVYCPEVLHTFTPDMFISYYGGDTDLVNSLLKPALARAGVTVAVMGPGVDQGPHVVSEQPSLRASEVEDTLRRISELPENWDSMGGPVISTDAIVEARSILTTAIRLNLPSPWVAPGGDAGVGIQWDTNRAELYIDIVPGEETTYVLTPKEASRDAHDGVLTKENLSGVLTQLAELSI